jgi:hypothetical protein
MRLTVWFDDENEDAARAAYLLTKQLDGAQVELEDGVSLFENGEIEQ